MKNFQITITSLLMMIVFSCDKNEKEEQSNIYGKWAATDFISVESVAYSKNDGFNPIW